PPIVPRAATAPDRKGAPAKKLPRPLPLPLRSSASAADAVATPHKRHRQPARPHSQTARSPESPATTSVPPSPLSSLLPFSLLRYLIASFVPVSVYFVSLWQTLFFLTHNKRPRHGPSPLHQLQPRPNRWVPYVRFLNLGSYASRLHQPKRSMQKRPSHPKRCGSGQNRRHRQNPNLRHRIHVCLPRCADTSAANAPNVSH